MRKTKLLISGRKQRMLLYLILLSAGIGLYLAGCEIEQSGNIPPVLRLPCLFHDLLHLYCPGCGGTRAFLALLKGNYVRAIQYNPFFCYLTGIYLWYLIQEGIWMADKREKLGIHRFQFQIWIVWLGLAIFFGYFLIRNGAYLLLRLDWTGDFLNTH